MKGVSAIPIWAVLLLLVAPLAGAMTTLACAGDCCCGPVTTCGCHDSECMLTLPASPAPVAVASEAPVISAATPAASETSTPESCSSCENHPVRESSDHAPPPLYLQNSLLLI